MNALLVIADLIKPFFNLAHVLIMLCISAYAIYSLRRRFDFILALFTAGIILDTIVTTIWFIFGLQTAWKITLMPGEIRRISYLFIQIAYPFEILIWASVFFQLARRNIVSPSPLREKQEF